MLLSVGCLSHPVALCVLEDLLLDEWYCQLVSLLQRELDCDDGSPQKLNLLHRVHGTQ